MSAISQKLNRVCKRILTALALPAIIALTALSPRAALGASVTTDQQDYAPFSIVNITGAGFQAGETVNNQVVQVAPSPAAYPAWTVVADANGGFITTWYVFTDDLIGTTLQLTSTGQSSGLTASATFTDAAETCPPLPGGTALVNPPTGGFGIDGDLFANTPTANIGDWMIKPTSPPSGTGGAVLDASGNPIIGTTTFHLTDPFNSSTDNNFSGGKKFNDDPSTWTWVSNPVNDKQDINNALLHVTTSSDGHTWVIISADRLSDNGNAYIDFEFLQKPLTQTTNIGGTTGGFTTGGLNCGRTTNDFILTLNFINGGTQPGMCFSRWEAVSGSKPACGFDYVERTSLLPADKVFAAVNGVPINVPYGAFGGTTYSQNTFAEAAVDLTALISGIDPCLSIGVKTLLVKTKESQSDTATIVDFISPKTLNLQIGPTANAGADQTKCCTDGVSFTLAGSASAGIFPNVSTNWSVVSGSAHIVSPNSLSTTVDGIACGSSATLRLTIVDDHNCSKTDDVVLTVRPVLACTITGPAEVNSGDQDVVYSGPASMASYSWAVSGNPDVSIDGSSTSPTVKLDVVLGATGSFTLTLTIVDQFDCTSTCEKIVDIRLRPAACEVSPVLFACAGTVHTYTSLSDVTDPLYDPSYAWSLENNTSGAFIVGSTTGSSVNVNAGPNAGGYRVHVTITAPGFETQNCTADTTVNPLPACSITGQSPVCPNSLGHTYSGPPGMASYFWSISGNGTFASGAPNPTTPTVTVNAGGICAANFTLTLTVTDANACSRTCYQSFLVNDTIAPVITATGRDGPLGCNPIAAVINAALGTATATDNCGVGAPSFTDGPVTGTCTKSQTRTWTVSDSCGNAATPVSRTATWTDDTQAPVILAVGRDGPLGCNPIPAVINAALGTATATDNCGVGTPSFTDGPVTGTCTKSQTRTWTVSDNCGNAATPVSRTATWTDDTQAPVILAVGRDGPLGCNPIPAVINAALGTATATDNCGVGTPSFTDGPVTGTCTKSQTRTWTVSDNCGNAATPVSRTATWTDDTIKPVILAVGRDGPLGCNPIPAVINAALGTATATDNCGVGTPSFTDGPVTGTCTKSQTRTWTVSDNCGNAATPVSRTATWTDDTQAPVILAVGRDGPLGCNPIPAVINAALGTATATDNCGVGTPSFTDGPVTGTCTRSQTRTWTVSDNCGNAATPVSRTATWTVDTIKPVITCPEFHGCVSSECPDPEVTGYATATDNCGGTPTITYKDSVSGTCPKTITRTWTATDACGNTASCDQYITSCCTPSLITDTSRCTLLPTSCNPENGFRLLFTPGSPCYKLNSSNPGQFYYNVFYTGTPGSPVTFNVSLPYPFVTQGANPIEGYKSMTSSTSGGQTCLTPGTKFLAGSTQVTLANYGANPVVGVTPYTFPVTVTVPLDTGFVFLAIHLDYGLKGTAGYTKSASGNDAVACGTPAPPTIPDLQDYTFSVGGAITGSATAESCNVFKKNPGVGGAAVSNMSTYGVPGAGVVLKEGKTVLTTGQTDEDGWYMLPYKWTGKAATLSVTFTPPGGPAQTKSISLKANGFVQQDFTVP